MASRGGWALVMLALLAGSQAQPASAPSAMIAGTPTYTVSSDGLKMLFANPYDCEQPATSALTWVIKLDQPQTVYSFQVAVVDASEINEIEKVVVRVGNSDPIQEGSSSNSLCAIAELNGTSAMAEFECDQPLSGSYITITRNDGGKMNVCGFSANLGYIALPPVAMAPTVYVPAAELNTPESSQQMTGTTRYESAGLVTLPPPAQAVPTLPILQQEQRLQVFASALSSSAPAPAPGLTLAPDTAMHSTALPVIFATAAIPTAVPTPALAPAPVLTTAVPTTAPAPASVLMAAVPTPAPSQALPVMTVVPTPAPQEMLVPTPAPQAPAPAVPAPAPSTPLLSLPRKMAPAPVPQKMTPTPAPAPQVMTPAPAPQKIVLAPAPLLLTALPGPAGAKIFTAQPQPTPQATPAAAQSTATGQTGSAQATPQSKHDGLSGGAIAGIVIACVAAAALAAALAIYLSKHRTSRGGMPLTSRVNPTYAS